MLELALDIFLIVLLTATIAYAVLLNRRLARLRRGRAELEQTIADFNTATRRAEDSISGLKAHAGEPGRELDGRLQRARAACDELAFLVEGADEQARRLAGGIHAPRDGAFGSDAHGGSAMPKAAADLGTAESGSDRELMESLQRLR